MGDIQSDSLDMDLLIRLGSSFGPGPLSLHFGPVLRSLGVVLGASLLWAWLVGLRAYFSNPISCPQPLCMLAWARAVILLVSVAVSMCLFGAGLVKALSPSYVL